ncbi:MAG: protein adenylyltransferase SelO [Arenimonas sp.]
MKKLHFDNAFIRELPADLQSGPGTRQVQAAAYSLVTPTPVEKPSLLAHSTEVAKLLDLDDADIGSAEFLQAFSGNTLLPGMEAYAANYGGHQFGHWAGQLGDGRAIALGEVISSNGQRWELQLKGAGPTPYSRHADGRAVLRSSLREFVCSEAMHHLGVPSTRARSLITSGEDVVRDMFYSGDAKPEPGAIVCRVSPSFIRFGNFELPASRGDVKLLDQLVQFCIARDFPHLKDRGENKIGEWFLEICERTAVLMAHWMRVGFVHGVMNTDNMSILGLTIDYGPYGWLENFDPDWTPNTTDAQGRRYAYGKQPAIAQWNLSRLAGAIAPLLPEHEVLNAGLNRYGELFNEKHREMNAAKLGLLDSQEADALLVQDLFRIMQKLQIDMTLFFRTLADIDPNAISLLPFEPVFYDADLRNSDGKDLLDWLARYASRIGQQEELGAVRRERMNAVNPLYVPRNWLAQQAIDTAEQGDASELHALMEVLRNPYREQAGRERFALPRPEWARNRAGCSMLSCSS